MDFVAVARAGISTIPVDTQNKRPMVTWAEYQDHIADHDELIAWSSWQCGIGAVCGEVSGRLIAIDIEGGFRHRLPELAERLRAAGLFELFESWVEGYTETTPRGGLHILVHVGGEGRVDRNTKLAMASDNQTVLIETRGEGGYVIIAPSRNGTRGWDLVSGGLDQIAWATAEEWAAVVAVLVGFDESSRPAPAPQPRVTSTPPILRLGTGWIDDALAQLPPMAEVLEGLGFTYCSTDEHGTLWARPGKDPREGHSARINHNDRLMMFSSSTPLPASERTTYDQIDVIFAYRFGRPPSQAERVDALRPPADAGGAARQAAEPNPAIDHPGLDNAFWQSADWLTHIRSAAWARGLAPSGVLGAYLSAFATTVPMGIWLPPVWGDRAPLNTYCCLVGQSGSGKTASMRLALDLLGPTHNPDILLNRSLRSGEGLINLATKTRAKRREELGEDVSWRNAVQITFDEGAALGKQAERAGATVIPYLNTAWAGSGAVGGAKAGESGYFPADLVRVCAVIGVQFGAAANLFTGESAALGFPQRLLFFGLRDPEMMDHDVDAMSLAPVARLHPPELVWSTYVRNPRYLGVDAAIVREVRTWTQNKEHGTGLTDPLDGHMMQLRLRVSGLFALMADRWDITPQDWDLSSRIASVSRTIRHQLQTALGDVHKQRARALGEQDVIREEIRDDAWLNKRARRIAAFVRNLEAGASMKDIKSRLDATERRRRDEIVQYAVARGWLVVDKGRVIHRGE